LRHSSRGYAEGAEIVFGAGESRGCTFMDSGGLRGVLDAWLRVTDGHASFALVVPRQGRSRRVFELTGMLDRLEIAGTREQAVARASSAR
jgi:hypothetical protein